MLSNILSGIAFCLNDKYNSLLKTISQFSILSIFGIEVKNLENFEIEAKFLKLIYALKNFQRK